MNCSEYMWNNTGKLLNLYKNTSLLNDQLPIIKCLSINLLQIKNADKML